MTAGPGTIARPARGESAPALLRRTDAGALHRRPSHVVLVTDGEQRSALAIVRSLGRAGHRVVVTSRRERSLAAASRYAGRSFSVPDPLREPAAYADAILSLLEREGADTLIPVTEPSMLALLPLRERLPGVRIPFPDEATFRGITDKAALLAAADRLGIAVPGRVVLHRRPSSAELAALDVGFPVVVKPSRSVSGEGAARVSVGVRYAADRAELARRIDGYPDAAFPVMVQRRIVGPGVGIFLLDWGGEPLATFAHRRLRERPPAGGVSVYCESVRPDPDLVERSRALLRAFGWDGVAMVEYKLDASSGRPHLMEINARFWGSLQLAVDAGVDFPLLLLEAAHGRRPRPVHDYAVGVRSRWWWGEVDHLLARMRRSSEDLSLPPGSPTRLQAFRECLTLWRSGDRQDVLRPDDPAPFLRESLDWFRGR